MTESSVTKESCEENPYSVQGRRLGVDHGAAAGWNSFLWPLIISNSINLFTVPVGLNGFLGQQGSQWHLLITACAISMLLAVIMVLLLQRHLVRGIALSGFGGR